ncbi:phosphoglycolate phosphatase [Aestuariivirga litoralis]|uniref:Phosphoglycolate phosphatase n=1 Tax=Aestuariivirga litoralis TaxID=2650924 RepID=A0A2W2AVH7_9HYPH|nr:phosphoglycolate phosphatase [Aestuariivirga litoralis]PZF77712.1 phosphoglycolate phosphatase [Aestuariivirga litoralis]
MPDRAVIFDLDGTLVDTAPDLMRATNFVLTGMGRRPLEMPEVRAFVGHGARALLTRGLAATGGLPDAYDVEADYRRFVDYYAANIAQGSAPFPGLVSLLDRLKDEGYGLGVCTNKLEGLSVLLLEALDLAKYFGSVVGPDTLGIAKPDPKPFFEAVNRLDLDSPRAIMVGDSETDILTARNAGVPVIAVPFGYTPRPVAEFAPDRLIGHFDEAYGAIEELFAEA